MIRIKNISRESYVDAYLGIVVEPQEVVDLTDQFSKDEIAESLSLIQAVESGVLVVGDEVTWLTTYEALKHLSIVTAHEDQVGVDGLTEEQVSEIAIAMTVALGD